MRKKKFKQKHRVRQRKSSSVVKYDPEEERKIQRTELCDQTSGRILYLNSMKKQFDVV